MLSPIRTALVAGGCALTLLVGCHTSTSSNPNLKRQDFDGRDDAVVMPNLRAVVIVDGESTHGGALRQVHKEGVEEAYADLYSIDLDSERVYGGLEVEYWTAGAGFTQSIGPNDRLDPHGDNNLDGPGVFDTKVRLHLFSLGAHGGYSRGVFVANGTIGLNLHAALFDIDEVGGTRDADEELWRFGISFGGMVGVKPIVEWALFYVRFMGHWGIHEHHTWLSTFDAGAQLTVFPGVSVFLAYRLTNFVAERDDSDHHKDSDYDVKLEGPVFGLSLTF